MQESVVVNLCSKVDIDTFPYRILGIKEVCVILNRSKSMIYLDMNPRSKYYKEDFPRPIQLSASSIGWRAIDIINYINSLANKG